MNAVQDSNSTDSIVNTRWPDAQWDVSGAFVDDRELLLFHDFFLQATGIKLIRLVHGAPLFLWNSGRVHPRSACTPEQMRNAGLAYAHRGIAVDLTFTNNLLKPEHMNNPLGNSLLEFFEKTANPTEQNAVICASDALYDHVGKNFPKLKRVSSILKVSCEGGRGKPDYYRRLAERFDKVMIHPDDARNFEMLAQLEDKDRYEVIVNEYCIRDCKLRARHYKYVSNLALNFFGYFDEKFEELWHKNGCNDLNVLVGDPARTTVALSLDEMTWLYDLGFRKFKVQGRGMRNGGGVIIDLLRLALRDDTPGENFMQRLKLQFLEATAALSPKI